MLGVALIPTPLFAQSFDPNARMWASQMRLSRFVRVTGEQKLRLSVPGEDVRAGRPPPRRAASHDSLRNGAVIGAAVGAAVLGGLAATIGHMHRESGGPSCVPDSLRFAAAWAQELPSTLHATPIRWFVFPSRSDVTVAERR